MEIFKNECSLWNSCKKLLTLLRWDWRVFAKSFCILNLFLNKLNQYAHLKDTDGPSLVQQIIVFSWSREAKYRSQEPQYLIGICSVNMSRLKSAKVFNPIPRLYITCRLSTYESHITVIFFQYSQVGDWSLILWNYNCWKKPPPPLWQVFLYIKSIQHLVYSENENKELSYNNAHLWYPCSSANRK